MKKILMGGALLCTIVLIAYFALFRETDPSTVAGDPSLERVMRAKTLVVGTNIPYGIMEFRDENSNPAGVDIEIAREIAKALGVELKIVDYSWDDLFVAIKSGEIDLALSSISITQERGTEMLFSTPYFSSGQILITQKANTNIASTADITDKRVGIQKGTTAEATIGTMIPVENMISYESGPEQVLGILNGEVDAIVTDYIEAITVVTENPALTLRGETFSNEFYGVATRLGNDALIQKVNEVLRELKRNGRILEIERQFHTARE